MNDAFVLKTLPDRKFNHSNSMLFQWCRHQDALEPRRERFQKEVTVYGKKVWEVQKLIRKGKTMTTSTRNRRRVEAIGFIHRCALRKFLEVNPTNAPAGWKCTGCQKWKVV